MITLSSLFLLESKILAGRDLYPVNIAEHMKIQHLFFCSLKEYIWLFVSSFLSNYFPLPETQQGIKGNIITEGPYHKKNFFINVCLQRKTIQLFLGRLLHQFEYHSNDCLC